MQARTVVTAEVAVVGLAASLYQVAWRGVRAVAIEVPQQ
jgi:hypothetical protein